MSATLTWASSGAITKTGTTIATLLDDIDTMLTAKAGDATFYWQKASKSSASTPYYLVLKPKSGAAGRILLLCYTSAPAGTQPVLFDQAPSTNVLYVAYFPNGNIDTPTNLTAASGTVMGSDTGAVKVSGNITIASCYAASVQVAYFDSAEAMAFLFQNPASAAVGFLAAGNILVDAADSAYAAVMSTGTTANFGNPSNTCLPWTASTILAGAATSCVRTNYGATNRTYFSAWLPNGQWANATIGPGDILTDTATSRAWFVPLSLLGQAKGEGLVLKLRQIGLGPSTTGPLVPYNTTGPVVAARQVSLATAGSNGAPWLTNFKL